MTPKWFPDWSGETIVIVASGPSATSVPLDLARGKARVITINNSWKLAPWAEMLFACDCSWWDLAQGCPEFAGMKVTIDAKAKQKYPNLGLVRCRKSTDKLVLRFKGTVGWGGNSGFHCLNLAVQFGAAKIILVGFDMTLAGGVHWHGEHPRGMNNPTARNIARWRDAIDATAKQITPLGIRVINCSPVSALRKFPKMTLEQAVAA